MKLNVSKKFLFYVIANFLFIFLIYSFFICNQLINTNDGLWNADGYYIAGGWDASIGRWLLPIFTRIKLGFSVEPVNSLISLFLISIISVLVVDLFNQLNSYGVLISFVISLSATFTSQMAYSYMSQSFILAEFYAIISLYIILKFNNKIKYILSLLFFIGSLSFYQAAIALYSITYLFYIINEFVSYKFNIKLLLKNLQPLFLALVGCILYYLIWTIACVIVGIEKSSYFGANELNIITMVKSFFNNIIIIYGSFLDYIFNGGVIRQNPFSGTIFFILIIVLFCLTLIFIPILKLLSENKQWYILIYICVLIISPLFCNPQKFLAVDSEILPQTSIGYTMFFPLAVLFIINCFPQSLPIPRLNIIKLVVCFIVVLTFFERMFQISIDFCTMYRTRETAVNIMDMVAKRIVDEGIYTSNYNYVFLGKLSDNKLYRKARIYDYANFQYVIGNFYNIVEGSLYGYRSLLNYNMGLNFKFDANVYRTIFDRHKNGEYNDLEAFPNKDCYIIENNTVIFKVAE